MAKIVQRDYDIKVNTWSDLSNIPYPKDGMKVTVLDAIGDTRTLGGTVVYQYVSDYAGTPEQWMILSQSNEEAIQTVEENLLIVGGKVTLANVPNGNVLLDVIATWVEGTETFIEEVAYSVSGQDVFVSSYYDGKTLKVKYLKNTSGKLYQLGTNSGTVSFNDLTDKPTTIDGYGITDGVKWTTGDILPLVPGVSNIGSATNKFAAIYTKEMHIDANTLYVDGVPVLGSSSNTIQITADTNQGMRIATTGTGQTILDSQATTTIQTNGTNADVLIQAGGTGSRARVTSNTEVIITSPTSKVEGNMVITGDTTSVGNHTVNGNLTVLGTTTQLDVANLQIEDNIILVNKGELGSGVSLTYAGIQVDRGDLSDARIVWDENSDKFIAGVIGSEQALATETYVASAISAINTIYSFNDLTDKPTTLVGYGILDAYTKTEVNSLLDTKANIATTLLGYGITDAYTKTEVDSLTSSLGGVTMSDAMAISIALG